MKNKKAEKYSSSIIKEVLKETSSGVSQKIRNKMLLAAKIDKAIISKGLSKIQFAEKLNKHPSVITKWISGTHNFTTDTLWDIENLLDINLVELGNFKKEQVIVYKIEIKSENNEINFEDYNDSILIDSPIISQTYKTGFDC